jgi:hypothetical protein
MYGGIKHMIEEKIRLCKQAGVKSQISYKIQTGKPPVDEIINVAQVMNVDLIIMASSKPVLVIHEQKQIPASIKWKLYSGFVNTIIAKLAPLTQLPLVLSSANVLRFCLLSTRICNK